MARRLTEIEALEEIARHSPLAFATDIDGTLAPVVVKPEAAVVSAKCRALLGSMLERGVQVMLVTGRTIQAARSMVDLEGAVYAANHGLTLWVEGREETPDLLKSYVPRVREAMSELGALSVPGVVLEDKGHALGIHYRLAPDPDLAQAAILSALERSTAARHFRIYRGRKVLELRPPLALNKGTAVAELVRRLGTEAIICVGDDATDIDMFETVRWLREGDMPAVNIAVNSEEAPPLLLAQADYWVDGVAGVEWLLEQTLRVLPAKPP